MYLVIDQGNTKIKLAFFKGKDLQEKIAFSNSEFDQAQQWIDERIILAKAAIVSSVSDRELNIPTDLLITFDHRTPLPIKNDYQSPETLGRDRLANAVGAWSLNEGKNSLVIDMGTCIKYDLVNENGHYLGGIISPGLQMRYTALHNQTAQLPQLSFSDHRRDYGVDTISSITEGVQQGMEHEILGFIQRYNGEFPDLTIFMTGGDINYFDLEFKNSIFAQPDLTLIGLYEILKYNVRP